ncbi:hypothetical protein KCU64_g20667, partial [Aureobasidium melanogenum]
TCHRDLAQRPCVSHQDLGTGNGTTASSNVNGIRAVCQARAGPTRTAVAKKAHAALEKYRLGQPSDAGDACSTVPVWGIGWLGI